VGESGEITQTELVERLVMGTDVVGYHLRKLVRARRLLSSKDGKMRVYFPLKK